MPDQGFKRKLTAILSTDVEGYSRLMDDDEEATVRTITSYRSAITDLVQQYRGRVVDSPGDNILAEFASVVDSVNCAVEIQRDLAERNTELPDHRKMQFRIGVNLGDVIAEDGRIYGDGVNIAARVESLAEAGGICISGRAHDQVENKLGLEYEDLGKHEVKNISRPIQVYRVLSYPGAAAHRVVQAKKTLGRRWRKIGFSAAAIVLVAVALGVWQFYMRRPAVEPASVDKMALPLPEKPSIAVLSFDNMSGDSGQAYLGDGFAEQIITNLSMVPKLFVIARNSSFSFKGKPVKVQQVAEELGVRYVLEGSVQKSGEKVRINAQLIDAVTGRHLWAEKYDRELKDIFELQDEISLKIISSVGAEVTRGERARIIAKGTNNVDAYIKVVQGYEYIYRQQGVESNLQARKLAEEAIAIDPGFPDAYCILGTTHFMDVFLGASKSPQKSLEESLRLFEKALALDESHPIANGGLAFVYAVQKQWEKAIIQAQRGIEINPGAANPHVGTALMWAGRYEESIQWFKKVVRLDPKGPAFYFLFLGNSSRCLERYDEAIAYLKTALDRQPGNFIVHLQLAAIYATTGRQDEAQAEAAAVLSNHPQFSVDKFGKTLPYKDQVCKERLIEGLLKAGLPDKPPLPLPDNPSIAVLAFDNLSNDPEQEYFSDGLAEDIITALSKTPKIFVIARNSSFTYKGKPVKVQQIGRELGVRYVLEGSVRKVGEQVRITAQLVDAKTGHHLWAEKYDRDLSDVFALQDEITMRIIEALEVKLTEGEQARIRAKGTDNLAAYLNVLEARELARHQNIDHNRKARQLLEKAIELDPNYAPAYKWLSSVNAVDVVLGASKAKEESLKTAVELAKKALSIDRSYGNAHGIIGWIYVLTRQYEKAIPELKKALELDPNEADNYMYLTAALLYIDDLDEGILMANKAIRLNPIPPSLYLNLLAALYRSKGNYKEALVWSEKAVKQEPKDTIANVNLCSVYYLSGREEDARLQAKEVLKLNPKFSLKKLEKMLPYKNFEVKKQYIDALRNAGLPD